MHMTETCLREFETIERGLHMPRYLGTLAGCTRACPCAAVFPHSQPHKPLRHQLDSGVGSGVALAVEGVKNLASDGRGYEWLWFMSGCVTVEVDIRPGSVYPVQPKRLAIFQDVLQLRILILGTRKSLVIKRRSDKFRSR